MYFSAISIATCSDGVGEVSSPVGQYSMVYVYGFGLILFRFGVVMYVVADDRLELFAPLPDD